MKRKRTARIIARVKTGLRYLLTGCIAGWAGLQYVQAQDMEFWFAAPDLADPVICGEGDSPMVFIISNSSMSDSAHVVLEVNNGGSPVTYRNTIAPGGVFRKEFTSGSSGSKWQVENPRKKAGNVTDYGIHITSDVRVTAYYQVLPPCNQDIFSLKGAAALGTQFYVPMIHDSYYFTGSYGEAFDQIDIVATEDGTTVNVTPTKDIRIGESGSSIAGTTITRTLGRGQTLKIMEHVVGNAAGSATLAGTYIVSNKPVAVTTTEDLIGRSGTGWDIVGDQIVPFNSLGKTYVVVKGLLSSTSDRAYFLATRDGTTITFNSGSSTTSTTLNAGQSYVFDLGTNGLTNAAPNSVLAKATYPVYCYHISGHSTELGSALLPSIYSISQMSLPFYGNISTGTNSLHGFLVFRTGTHTDFTVTCDGKTTALSLSPFAIPGMSEWQAAKTSLPSEMQNKVINIRNAASPFSYGYFSINTTTGGASYGYLSAFGDFDFGEDTVYKCTGAPYLLDGGYALSYDWTLPDGSSASTSSLSAVEPGLYKLTVNHDPMLQTDSIWVLNRFEGNLKIVSSPAGALDMGRGIRTYSVDLSGETSAHVSYQWSVDGVPAGTAPTCTHPWEWDDEADVTVLLTDTVLGCSRTLVFHHLRFPENIIDADCRTVAPTFVWGIRELPMNTTTIDNYQQILAGDIDNDGEVEIIAYKDGTGSVGVPTNYA
ncbi:MAG: IgGFc-binding protein, partial [Tannerella sp.]|nr:IgGFc-binding protein [Tannerella sp.]